VRPASVEGPDEKKVDPSWCSLRAVSEMEVKYKNRKKE
jgi:hypothetical protein